VLGLRHCFKSLYRQSPGPAWESSHPNELQTGDIVEMVFEKPHKPWRAARGCITLIRCVRNGVGMYISRPVAKASVAR